MIFKIALRFKRSTYFYVAITRDFERFQYFNFETNFLKNENLCRQMRKIAENAEQNNSEYGHFSRSATLFY